MNWSIKEVAKVLLVGAVLSGGTLSGALDVWAQEKGSTLAQQIQGSWILVSIYNEQEGKKTDVFGPNPRGCMIFTPDGRFSYILMRASLPKFASNSRMKGTVEENRAVVQGSHATFGKFTVASDKEQTVNLHIEGSTFPNWDGQDQKRTITVIGDEMKVSVPTPSIGGGVNYLVWKRGK
jgi:Lipocalin-like domain